MASLLSKRLMKISQQLIFHSQLAILLLQSKILIHSWIEEAAGTFRNLAMFKEQPLLFVFIVNGVLDRLKRFIEFICQLPVGISLFNTQPQDLFHDWPWCDVLPRMFWHTDLSSRSLLYLFSPLLSIVHFSWGGAKIS